ncbi:MAG: gephyrin-like molybdotransferase Glp [Planctomycetota bacterium]
MLNVNHALETVIARTPAPPPEAARPVPLLQCMGRFLAQDVRSGLDLPPFSRSTMDGFAVRSLDVAEGSGLELPRRVIGESAAGSPARVAVGPGEAVRIFTGGMVPAGADAVIQVELTEEDAAGVRLLEEVRCGRNIAVQGEDLKRSDLALSAGVLLTAGHLGLCAAIGRTELPLFPPPRVGILSTGSELVPPGGTLKAGAIYESNGAMLAALTQRYLGEVVSLGHVGDEKEVIRERASRGLECDLFLLSGGSSVGDYDYTPKVLEELGVEVLFDKLALKPGKPTIFGIGRKRGVAQGCAVFGLPGNPISAYVVFHLLVRPALIRLAGGGAFRPPLVPAVLENPAPGNATRDQVLPAVLRLDGREFKVAFSGWHGSGDLTCLKLPNALLMVPRGREGLASGARVNVLPTEGGAPEGPGGYFG